MANLICDNEHRLCFNEADIRKKAREAGRKEVDDMTALRAKPYEAPRAERSFLDIVRALEKRDTARFPELIGGERGVNVSSVRLTGARDLSTGSDPAGGYLKGSSQPPTVIEASGAQTIAARAGAQFVPVQEIPLLPKEAADPGFAWVTEENAPAEADPTYGLIRPDMKTGVVAVDFSRVLSLVSGGLADRSLTRAFLRAIARGVDKAIFCGTGVDGQPQGVKTTSGVDTRTGATFAIATAAAMMGACEDGYADTSALSWCMAPDVAEKLRQRPKAASGERMLLEGGEMLGRPAYVSKGIDAGTLFLGDFSDVVVLVRAIELLFNPYTQGKTGVRELVGFWFGDVVVQHPAYFAIATAVS